MGRNVLVMILVMFWISRNKGKDISGGSMVKMKLVGKEPAGYYQGSVTNRLLC